MADPVIGSTLWNDEYLPHLFNYLLKYHTEWLENGEVIPETENQEQVASDILNFSDNFKYWLDSEIIKTSNTRDFVDLEDLKRKLLNSEYWSNLSKHNKGIGAYHFLLKELKDRVETTKLLVRQKTVKRKVIYGWFLTKYCFKDQYQRIQNQNNKLIGKRRKRSDIIDENMENHDVEANDKNGRKLRSKSTSNEIVEAMLANISNTINNNEEPKNKKRKLN